MHQSYHPFSIVFLNVLAAQNNRPIISVFKGINHSLPYSTVYIVMATPNDTNPFISIIEYGNPLNKVNSSGTLFSPLTVNQ